MKRILSRVFALLAVAAVLVCIGVVGWSYVRENCLIWDGRIYRLSTETVDLSGKELPDLSNLAEFPQLRRIDIRDTGAAIADYEALSADYPHCEILWDVPFQGKFYDARSQKITITSLTQEDIEVLA